jgi:hypothetical protein
MARYDNIGLDGKDAFEQTPSYDSIMKQKAKDTKKALHKQKKEDDAEAADKAMQEEIDKEYEAKKEVEKQALENNCSTVETRDKNKAIETQEPAVTAVEDIKTQTKTDKPENTEEFQIDTKANVTENEIPENVQKELDESDEAKAAKEAVENDDPSALQNIITPEGDAVLKGAYDKDGLYVPHVYTIEESRLVKNKGLAACLTIISQAISAFGLAAGIPIKQINFLKFGSTPEEDLEKLNENEQNYANVLNGTKTHGLTTENQRNAEREANLKDIEEYKDISDEEVQKAAQVNAATAGQNAQLDVQKQQQEFDKWKTEYSGELQKTMQEIQNKFHLDLTDKLYRQQVQEIVDKIAYMKESGYSNDDIAKTIQSMEGVTTLQRGMGYAKDTVGMVTDVVNSAGNIMHGRAYATRANAAAQNANSNMFRENRL